ncbi:MAG: acyl-CoA thioesterase [Acidimicrobiales bacterium]
MSQLTDLLAVLDLTPNRDGGFTADSLDEGHGVVFGGQLLAQTVVAAAASMPDKEVKSLHTVFARSAAVGAPLDIDVDVLHQGRALGSASVTIRQGDRICTRATVLLQAPDPDLIRHQPEMPKVAEPDTLEPRPTSSWWDLRILDDVDIADPDLVGPAELGVWSRFPDAPHDLTTSQALLAYASDGFLIGTAMRPHAGVGQSQAHVTISTTVLSHMITFHEPFDASRWLLLWHESPYAGRGRGYGRADVFTEDGSLVASYVQENMIRAFAEGRAPAAGERARH